MAYLFLAEAGTVKYLLYIEYMGNKQIKAAPPGEGDPNSAWKAYANTHLGPRSGAYANASMPGEPTAWEPIKPENAQYINSYPNHNSAKAIRQKYKEEKRALVNAASKYQNTRSLNKVGYARKLRQLQGERMAMVRPYVDGLKHMDELRRRQFPGTAATAATVQMRKAATDALQRASNLDRAWYTNIANCPIIPPDLYDAVFQTLILYIWTYDNAYSDMADKKDAFDEALKNLNMPRCNARGEFGVNLAIGHDGRCAACKRDGVATDQNKYNNTMMKLRADVEAARGPFEESSGAMELMSVQLSEALEGLFTAEKALFVVNLVKEFYMEGGYSNEEIYAAQLAVHIFNALGSQPDKINLIPDGQLDDERTSALFNKIGSIVQFQLPGIENREILANMRLMRSVAETQLRELQAERVVKTGPGAGQLPEIDAKVFRQIFMTCLPSPLPPADKLYSGWTRVYTNTTANTPVVAVDPANRYILVLRRVWGCISSILSAAEARKDTVAAQLAAARGVPPDPAARRRGQTRAALAAAAPAAAPARVARAPATPAAAQQAAEEEEEEEDANLSNTNTLETNTEESLEKELEIIQENIPRVTALNGFIEENLAALQIELRSIDERITDLNVRNEEAKRIPEEGERNDDIRELEQERLILIGEREKFLENINGESEKLRTLVIRTRIYADSELYVQRKMSTLTNNAQIAEHKAQIAEYQREIDSESKKLRGRNAQINAPILENIREVRAEITRIRAIIRDLTIQQERINLEAARLRTRINAYTQLMKDEEEDAQKNLLDGWEYAGRDDEYNALQWVFTDGTITYAKPVRQVAQAPARPTPARPAPARPTPVQQDPARAKVMSPYEQRHWIKGGAITHKKGNKTRISKKQKSHI